MSLCPKCDNEIGKYPAISRRDNKTEICSECGEIEAWEDYHKSLEQKFDACERCGSHNPTVTDTRWGKKLCMNCSYIEIDKERHTEGYTPFGDE